jgi:molybdate transport system substrate-binding protein
LSAGAAQGLVSALAIQSGVEVQGVFGAVGAMRERYLSGEPCDIVILTHAQIAGLAAEDRVEPRMSADLGCVSTCIAVRARDAAPDVSNEAALAHAIGAADAIYMPDPERSTAGIHFARVLERLGDATAPRGKWRVFPNGATAMREMSQAAGRPIGCTQATEILATPGVRLVAPLPPGFDLSTVYTVAVNRGARDPQNAETFFERLVADEVQPERTAAGFEGIRVRPATSGDGAAVRSLVSAVLREYGLNTEPDGVDRDLADIDASYVAPGGTFDVAVAPDARVVGCSGVLVLDGERCELRKMYVAQEARGQGLGTRLLERALAFARARRFGRVELETASVLKEAIALYTRAGFQPVEHTGVTRRCDRAYALEL